jgi:UDP-N-acetylmuramoyl-L-alanyl-D-glutamate--2,6-diaminopimelate ligase
LVSFGEKAGDLNLKNVKIDLGMPGEFNKLNALVAMAVGQRIGIVDMTIRAALKSFKGINGRMDEVKTGKGFRVIIDFAHTPHGLEELLKSLRPIAKKRLIHVFGCAGLRDYLKRPLLGAISARYAQIIVLTEEDTRTEDIDAIMDSIAHGITKTVSPSLSIHSEKSNKRKEQYLDEIHQGTEEQSLYILKIPDRQDAISTAVSLAKKGDMVVVTGKGHEKSLCRGTKEYPWSEHEAVKKALRQISNSQ